MPVLGPRRKRNILHGATMHVWAEADAAAPPAAAPAAAAPQPSARGREHAADIMQHLDGLNSFHYPAASPLMKFSPLGATRSPKRSPASHRDANNLSASSTLLEPDDALVRSVEPQHRTSLHSPPP